MKITIYAEVSDDAVLQHTPDRVLLYNGLGVQVDGKVTEVWRGWVGNADHPGALPFSAYDGLCDSSY
jgi:hypothetical protein